VANVGDLKGNELPTAFFLTYAWYPDRGTFGRLAGRERRYARQNFQDAWFERSGTRCRDREPVRAAAAEFTDLLYARQGRAAINSLAAQAEQAL
jgi:hypothetical protein